MFPEGKWPDHWVDSYVHMLRKKMAVWGEVEREEKDKNSEDFHEHRSRECINERGGIMKLNNEKEIILA